MYLLEKRYREAMMVVGGLFDNFIDSVSSFFKREKIDSLTDRSCSKNGYLSVILPY